MPHREELRRLAAALEDLNAAIAERGLAPDDDGRVASLLAGIEEAKTLRSLREVVINAPQFRRQGDERRLAEYRRRYIEYCSWASSLMAAGPRPLTRSEQLEREQRLWPLLELRRQLLSGAQRQGRLRHLEPAPRPEIGRDVDLDARRGTSVA